MMQKIVIKMHVCCNKYRSKAMKIAAVADGVMSVALEEKDKDKLVVTGDAVDAATLTARLRKKIGHAELISVEEVKEKKEGKEETKEKKDQESKPISQPVESPCQYQWYPFVYGDPYYPTNYRILY